MSTNTIHFNPFQSTEITEKEKNDIKEKAKNYAEYVRNLVNQWKNEGWKSSLEKAIEKNGENAVYKTGFHVQGIEKPVIVKMTDVDIFGDKYICPILYYVDEKYDFNNLDSEFIKSFDLGSDVNSYILSSIGESFIECKELGMETFAKQYCNNSRYTVSILKDISEKDSELNDGHLTSISEYYKFLLNSIKEHQDTNISEDAVQYCNKQLEAIRELREKIHKLNVNNPLS